MGIHLYIDGYILTWRGIVGPRLFYNPGYSLSTGLYSGLGQTVPRFNLGRVTLGLRRTGAYLQQSLYKRQGIPWRGMQVHHK